MRAVLFDRRSIFSLIESNARGIAAPLVIASFTIGVAALAGFLIAAACALVAWVLIEKNGRGT